MAGAGETLTEQPEAHGVPSDERVGEESDAVCGGARYALGLRDDIAVFGEE